MRFLFRRPTAMACVTGGEEYPCLYGTVKFYAQDSAVLMAVDICGLPENDTGFFAMHIHEGDRCSGEDFADTGSHYDPEKVPHPHHAGDLPPLISCGGRAYSVILTNRFCINEILGRTLVIHGGADDFHTQPAGNSGTKIACGVISKM